MKRIYDYVLKEHFHNENKMAFLVGPRQVGKTTTSLSLLTGQIYLNWDNQEHRKIILKGPAAIINYAGIDSIEKEKKYIIFDEIHKYPKWKNFLKGFFDTYRNKVYICVTGSARLDVFKYGGDSMMGRYFLFRMHPITVKEIINPQIPSQEISPPEKIGEPDFDNLLKFGGYPEPFLRHEQRFFNKWKNLRLEQLFNEDVRDISKITDIGRIKVLAERLAVCTGSSLNYSNLANDIQVTVDTIRRWLNLLESLYYCFRIRPYSKNIARSLLKEPKIFLWDWSLVNDTGKKNENFIASHLLKAVHFYNDMGFGKYELYYLRDKDKREVDFFITKDEKPWLLIEAKTSEQPISESLIYFKKITHAPYAFQLTFNLPFTDIDYFKERCPIKVPVKTFLSQLI